MAAAFPEEAKNFRLIGHDPTAAWGGGSLVAVHKGHAYVGAVGGSSFNGPEGFTVHDVRDPRKPKKVGEFRAPPGVHCHKLRIVGDDLLYVNSERLAGDKGKNARAGFFIFDVSTPSAPKPIGFYDMPGSGPHRFGVDLQRHLAFMPNDAPGWDKRVIWTLDIRDPLHPEVVSIWGLPWMKTDTNEVGNDPHPQEQACTLHGPPMIRGNRMYCAWWGGGVSIIDCTDLTAMKLVGHIKWSPPFPGSTHTCWPIGERPYLVVTDEARAKEKYWDAQFMWIIDAREEKIRCRSRPSCRNARNISTGPAGSARTTFWRTFRPKGHGRTSCFSPTSMPGCARSTSATRCIRRKWAVTCPRRRPARRASSRTTSAPTTTAASI